MADSCEHHASDSDRMESAAAKRSQDVTVAAWLAGVTAVVGFLTLGTDATFGSGFGAVGISGMVTIVCYLILRAK
jgi:hypothetical protein